MAKLIKTPLSFVLIFNIYYAIAQNNPQQMEPLVDVHWLKEHIHKPDVVVVDASVVVSFDEEGQFKMTSGKTQYDSRHIPNAIFANLLGELSAKDTNLHFVMPTPKQFQKALSDLGISNDSQVVIYSTQPAQSWAQRLWWMLHWAGHDNIAILDGGFNAWLEAGFPVSSKPVNRNKSHYKIHLRNQVIADRNEVYGAINDKNVTIIDALPIGNYNGEFSTYERRGHIESAINVPTDVLVTDTGHYKPIEDLKTLFNSNPENRIITYCGGGVAASSTAFALHRLGYEDVAVYMGSLQEWAANKENPMSVEQ